ncbi:MAG: protein phosphatase 2C domain-containing protein [Rothia sp. (in: high G+C Gram-positive bacteria)]|nr:protein phosphatase 2C domain-containing protein [Rothia sp. (in: high G+C Gram-positive bacteria)]
MGIAFRFAARSDLGCVRSKNDDSGYAGHYLAVVADGMGGHVGGDVASATTVLDLTPLDHPGFNGSAGVYLADEITTANMIMNELVDLNPRLAGMGTTCTALLIDNDQIALAHIGDSRAYRLRGDTFEQITTDHTFVQRLIEEGRISAEEAEHHPHRNVIMRVLGDVDASPELETKILDAHIGERWVLSSDGLDSVVTVGEIEAIMRSTTDLQQITDSLVDLTLERGAPDNVTVLTLAVIDDNSLASSITAEQPIIPVRQYGEDGQPLGSAPDLTDDKQTQPLEDIGADPSGQRAPWPRRLPQEAKLRNALRHGKWRGESFSDGVFNMMTESSGMDEPPEQAEESSASVLRHELNERPHQLVGAAATATSTGMIPAVTDRTLERRATMVIPAAPSPRQEDTAELPEEIQALLDEEEGAGKNRWPLRIFTLVVTLAVIIAAVGTFFSWVGDRYYVGSSNNKVAVYSGIPESIGPLKLYEMVEETDIEVESLPEYSRSLIRSTIPADDLSDAQRILTDLQAQAALTQPAASEDATSHQPSPFIPSPGTVTTVEPEPSSESQQPSEGASHG